MATDYEVIDEEPKRSRPFLRALLFGGIAFAGGAASMGYVLTHWDLAAEYIGAHVDPTATTAATPARQGALAEPIDPRSLPPLEARVAELEGRLGSIGARANAAVGNADRAEGLLVAFAARRALDRGIQLGYIEALLRERFGGSQPQAVATIIAAGRQPITLEELQAGLSELGPDLAAQGPNEGWWDGVKRELAGLIIVRKSDAPSPAPADRLARANRQLEAGHVTAALAEVARMPGRERASSWIAKARRYSAAREALDVIETAALLEPRDQAPPPVAVTPPPVDPIVTAPPPPEAKTSKEST